MYLCGFCEVVRRWMILILEHVSKNLHYELLNLNTSADFKLCKSTVLTESKRKKASICVASQFDIKSVNF